MSDLKTNLEQILQEKETKIIPANIKKGIQIFDVEGTLESSSSDYKIKLFKTEEEMLADPTIKEHDLAVVYDNELRNLQNGETASYYIYFPETVTLDNAVTESLDITGERYNGSIDNTSMYIYDSWGGGSWSYSSTNGKTYTTYNEGLKSLVDFNISCSRSDIVPAFVKTVSMNFTGLFEATTHTSNYKYNIVNYSDLDDNNKFTYVVSTEQADKRMLFNAYTAANKQFPSFDHFVHYLDDEKNIYIVLPVLNDGTYPQGSSWCAFDSDGKPSKSIICNVGDKLEVYKYLPTTNKLELFSTVEKSTTYSGYFVFELSNLSTILMQGWLHTSTNNVSIYPLSSGFKINDSSWNSVNGSGASNVEPILLEYWYSTNQLSVTGPQSLLPGIEVYSNTGVIRGDGSIYNELDINQIEQTYINNDLIDGSMQIQYRDFIEDPRKDDCGLFGIKFALDSTKIKTINDYITNLDIIKDRSLYTDTNFLNSDNSTLSYVRDGYWNLELIAGYKNYNLYFIRVLENDVKIGKLLLADDNNNILNTLTISDIADRCPYILCYGEDETHYNVVMWGVTTGTSENPIISFKIDFSLPIESWLSAINNTLNITYPNVNLTDGFHDMCLFEKWAIFTNTSIVRCYNIDTHELFTVYNNTASGTGDAGAGKIYIKNNILYYNAARIQFAYNLANKTMINDASEKYEEYIGGEFRIQIDNESIHVCYDKKFQWNWNFSTNIKTNETKTISNDFPRWNRLSGRTDMAVIATPDTGKILNIDDSHNMYQDYGQSFYIKSNTDNEWQYRQYFKYIFNKIRYYRYFSSTKYYIQAQKDNNTPQRLVWLGYTENSDGMGGVMINWELKTLKECKQYNLQPLDNS